MDVVIIGTSNSVMGRNGYIKALKADHSVANLSVGRVPFYMHIKTILEYKEQIEKSDVVIIDHLSNPTFIPSENYNERMVDFYDILASLNTNVIILSFAHQDDIEGTILFNHRSIAKKLAGERGLPFVDAHARYFENKNFLDRYHINLYPSYLMGEWLSQEISKLQSKPHGGSFQGYSVIKPENATGKFSNSLLSRDYHELDEKSNLEFNARGEILSIEFASNGLCRFEIDNKAYHVLGVEGAKGVFHDAFRHTVNAEGGFSLKISGNMNSQVVTDHMENISTVPNKLQFIAFLIRSTFSFTQAENRQSINFNFDRFKAKLATYNKIGSAPGKSSNDKFIDLLRDTAVKLENIDLEKSYELMKEALKLRATGPFIKKKVSEYKLKLASQQKEKLTEE